MSRFSKYVRGHIERAEQEEKRRVELFNELNIKARSVARFIAEKYGLERVYLFGSLTDPERFHSDSDIDLAVLGLESSRFLDAWGDVEIMLEHPFDLVRLEKVQESLRDTVLSEGVVVYDRSRDEG